MLSFRFPKKRISTQQYLCRNTTEYMKIKKKIKGGKEMRKELDINNFQIRKEPRYIKGEIVVSPIKNLYRTWKFL